MNDAKREAFIKSLGMDWDTAVNIVWQEAVKHEQDRHKALVDALEELAEVAFFLGDRELAQKALDKYKP